MMNFVTNRHAMIRHATIRHATIRHTMIRHATIRRATILAEDGVGKRACGYDSKGWFLAPLS